MSQPQVPGLPDGLIAVVKQDCPTCELITPVLVELAERSDLTVFTQDDPNFPAAISDRLLDTDLALSWHHDIETVPTLLLAHDGKELDRTVGWSRSQWERVSGV